MSTSSTTTPTSTKSYKIENSFKIFSDEKGLDPFQIKESDIKRKECSNAILKTEKIFESIGFGKGWLDIGTKNTLKTVLDVIKVGCLLISRRNCLLSVDNDKKYPNVIMHINETQEWKIYDPIPNKRQINVFFPYGGTFFYYHTYIEIRNVNTLMKVVSRTLIILKDESKKSKPFKVGEEELDSYYIGTKINVSFINDIEMSIFSLFLIEYYSRNTNTPSDIEVKELKSYFDANKVPITKFFIGSIRVGELFLVEPEDPKQGITQPPSLPVGMPENFYNYVVS